MVAFAQQKKVAILETVDKVGDVPYGIKLQLRSSLSYAISRTSGYEGYDRVDLASITGEQNFQRTGMVSDEEIKKLGNMTGAQYVLIAEAALYDENNIIITAKMLDVETGRLTNSAPPSIADKDPQKMELACAKVAQTLLGTNDLNVKPSPNLAIPSNSSTSISNYVDLGLPSRTLWKDKNEEGYYSYSQAKELFGNNLPNKNQLEELLKKCRWVWAGKGYNVIGPNKNSIFLPASGTYWDTEYNRAILAGYQGNYISSSLENEELVYCLIFDFDRNNYVGMMEKSNSLSVRLVR